MKIKAIIITLIISLFLFESYANKQYFNLKSPHNTIYTHIESLNDAHFNLDRAASTLNFNGEIKEANKYLNEIQMSLRSKRFCWKKNCPHLPARHVSLSPLMNYLGKFI